MPIPEAVDGQIQGSHPINNRLKQLQDFFDLAKSNAQLDLVLGTYINDILLPRISTAADLSDYEPDKADAYKEVSDFILQALGISLYESELRQGQGPKLSIEQGEMNRLHRASQQSDHFSLLPIVRFSLPSLPGSVEIALQFQAGQASLQTVLTPSKTDYKRVEGITYELNLDTGISSDKIKDELCSAIGKQLPPEPNLDDKARGQKYYYAYKSEGLSNIGNALRTGSCDMRLGAIPMASMIGYKDKQAQQVAYALEHFARTSEQLLPAGFQIERYSGKGEIGSIAYQIKSADGKHQYLISLASRNSAGEYRQTFSVENIVLQKVVGQIGVHGSLTEFQQSLETDLAVTQTVLDWIYRYAENDQRETNIKLSIPDEEIADPIIKTGMVERLTLETVGRAFDELGGQKKIIARMQALARAVIDHMKGDGPQPGHALVIGKTGIGKTSLVSALLRDLVNENIPVYRVKSSPESGRVFAQDPVALIRLFLLASINGGVIYLPDLDTTVGIDEKTRDTVQAQLNRLLETTANLNRVWVIADTARPGSIRDSLIEAHRLGNHLVRIDMEKDIEAVIDLISHIVHNQTSRFGNQNDANKILASNDLDHKTIAQKIVKAGNIVPGRIAAIIENLLLTEQSITTNNLLEEIETARKWEIQVEKERAQWKENGWQTAFEHLQKSYEELVAQTNEQFGHVNAKLQDTEEALNKLREATVSSSYFFERLNDIYRLMDEIKAEMDKRIGPSTPDQT